MDSDIVKDTCTYTYMHVLSYVDSDIVKDTCTYTYMHILIYRRSDTYSDARAYINRYGIMQLHPNPIVNLQL